LRHERVRACTCQLEAYFVYCEHKQLQTKKELLLPLALKPFLAQNSALERSPHMIKRRLARPSEEAVACLKSMEIVGRWDAADPSRRTTTWPYSGMMFCKYNQDESQIAENEADLCVKVLYVHGHFGMLSAQILK
jgi:hypothetical protein